MWIWSKILGVKDTEENHRIEAKNRLNYLDWVLGKIVLLQNSGKINIFNYAHFYDSMMEERNLLKVILCGKEDDGTV